MRRAHAAARGRITFDFSVVRGIKVYARSCAANLSSTLHPVQSGAEYVRADYNACDFGAECEPAGYLNDRENRKN